MQTKLNELSISAADIVPAAPGGGGIAESASMPEVLQVAARLRASLPGPQKVLAVVGLQPDDGANELATLLAFSIAQVSQSPVVLVDGDSRLHRLSDQLEPASASGFADLAAGACNLRDLPVRRPVAEVTFIAAGNADNILGAPGCARALELLRQEYRWVVVAAPAYSGNPDAVTLASLSDGVVLSLAAGARRKAEVQAIQRELARLRVPLLGAVLMERGK